MAGLEQPQAGQSMSPQPISLGELGRLIRYRITERELLAIAKRGRNNLVKVTESGSLLHVRSTGHGWLVVVSRQGQKTRYLCPQTLAYKPYPLELTPPEHPLRQMEE